MCVLVVGLLLCCLFNMCFLLKLKCYCGFLLMVLVFIGVLLNLFVCFDLLSLDVFLCCAYCFLLVLLCLIGFIIVVLFFIVFCLVLFPGNCFQENSPGILLLFLTFLL